MGELRKVFPHEGIIGGFAMIDHAKDGVAQKRIILYEVCRVKRALCSDEDDLPLPSGVRWDLGQLGVDELAYLHPTKRHGDEKSE
jgi:hypothetical protein